ncbi:hypothetical protein BDN67DRAFT_562751 [Paxillus ammoniavirescens]|nr:hypothetical protein BDN67DRAFT_562751 [Paxillus ammoniavirescens]
MVTRFRSTRTILQSFYCSVRSRGVYGPATLKTIWRSPLALQASGLTPFLFSIIMVGLSIFSRVVQVQVTRRCLPQPRFHKYIVDAVFVDRWQKPSETRVDHYRFISMYSWAF